MSHGFSTRRRSRSLSVVPEQLESRLLLTPDLEIVSMEPGFLQEVTRETNGDNTASLFTKMFRRNIGTTAVQLNGGTPGDSSDDVIIKFFLSADTVLSPADQLVGTVELTATFAPNGGGEDVSQLAGEFTVKSIGNYIIAFIDADNIIAESNESNNLFVMDIRTPSVEITGAGSNVTTKRVASVDPAIGFLDGNNTNYNGGKIEAKMLDAQSGEFLQITRNGRGDDKLKLSGNQLKIGRRVIGTVTGNKTDSLTINFNVDVDQVDVQRALRSIGFKVLSDTLPERNFSFQMTDPNGNVSNLATKEVDIFLN